MSRAHPRVVETGFQRKWVEQRKKAGKKYVEHHLCVVCGAPAEVLKRESAKARREALAETMALLATQETKTEEVGS